jgi:hypothetical protein
MDPLTGLLAIIDRIVALINAREKQHDTLVKEIVEPLFKEIEPIVQDSVQIMRNARDLLANPSTEQFSVLVLQQQRERLLLARQKLRMLIGVYQESSRNQEVTAFLENVESCLLAPGSSMPIRDSPIFQLISGLEGRFPNTSDAKEYVERSISDLESAWHETVRAYAVIKGKHVL